VDLYEEEERYAPLGSDASVAFGFKDLRIENTLASPLYFEVAVGASSVVCSLHTPASVPGCTVEFREMPGGTGHRRVETLRRFPDGREEPLGISRYLSRRDAARRR
jgi:vancomycin resistance protein VanW